MDYDLALCQRITGLELKTLTCFFSGDNRLEMARAVLCCVACLEIRTLTYAACIRISSLWEPPSAIHTIKQS